MLINNPDAIASNNVNVQTTTGGTWQNQSIQTQPNVCPGCGRCNHCGRGNEHQYPSLWPQPPYYRWEYNQKPTYNGQVSVGVTS